MTERFVSAAEMMGRVLGLPGYAFATIEHPISSSTGDRLAGLARTALDQGRKLLLRA